MPWFVLYTRPKNEKKVTEKLLKLGFDAYCPMVTQIKQWSDRKKKIEMPLISSYVFINIEENQRSAVFEVHGVVRYLFWLGKAAIIREEEINVLKSSLQGIMATVEIAALKPGDQMHITQGPFKGKEGIVQQVEKNQIQLILKELGILIRLKKVEEE